MDDRTDSLRFFRGKEERWENIKPVAGLESLGIHVRMRSGRAEKRWRYVERGVELDFTRQRISRFIFYDVLTLRCVLDKAKACQSQK